MIGSVYVSGLKNWMKLGEQVGFGIGPTAVKNGTRPLRALVCAATPQAMGAGVGAASIVAYIA
jgi:hypothetical protein